MMTFARVRLATRPLANPSFLLLAANIASAGSQWMLVWLVATFGNAAAVGEYALALAIATPLFIVSDLSLRNLYVTLHRKISFASYLAVRLVATGIALTALVIVTRFNWVDSTILLLVGSIRAVNSVLDLAYGALQRRGRLTAIAASLFLNSFLSVAFGLLAFVLWGNVAVALVASLGGSLLTALVTVLPTARTELSPGSTEEPPERNVREIVVAGIPSGLAYASASLLAFIPVYLLSAFGTRNEVGLFAVLAYFPAFAALFFGSIQQASLHDFVRSFRASGNGGLLRFSLRALRLQAIAGLLAGGVVITLGQFLMTAIYGPSFSVPFAAIVPIGATLVLLPVINVAGCVLLTKNHYRVQLTAGIATVVITTAIGLAFRNHFSLYDASLLVFIGASLRVAFAVTAAGISLAGKRRNS